MINCFHMTTCCIILNTVNNINCFVLILLAFLILQEQINASELLGVDCINYYVGLKYP